MKKPQLCAPAMNTFMYEHPHTAKHLKILEEELNFIVIPPKVKLLACGDYGKFGYILLLIL
jgi:phosphopantothenoylcysteine decarboxylase